MPFLTIREILNKVEAFHSDFGERLRAAQVDVDSEEAKMMLSFLSDHQNALAEVLATIEKETPDGTSTLNEWVQFDTEVEDPRATLAEFQVSRDATGRDVMRAANELDVCLFCLYKGLAKGSSTPKAQRLFARLARMELDHQKSQGGNSSYY